MATKFFGQFLLERGVITQDVLLDAVQYQRSKIKPLCELAVKTGRITEAELQRLESDTPGMTEEQREAAIHSRIHSFQQLEASWRTLSERGAFLVEALSRKGHLSLEELDRLYKEYRGERITSEIKLDGFLADAPETREILTSVIEIALDLFTHYTGQTPEIVSITTSLTEIPDDAYPFRQAIMGDLNLQYVLLLPARIVHSVASHILQEKVETIDETTVDAVSEFLNVIVGNTCTKLSMRNYSVTASTPSTLTLDVFKASLPPDQIIVRAHIPDGDFYLAYLVDEA